MNPILFIAAAGLLSSGLALRGQTLLHNEHADIGINYVADAWDLHVHDETNDVEYEPDEVILRVNANAQTTVSANPLFSFLGAPGSPVWILPNIQDPGLLFLGIGAEELPNGVFVGDTVSLRLQSVIGPGEFSVFDYDTFGNPIVVMNTRDGVSAADSFTALAGNHSDLNWAFSQPGTYTVNLEASGMLANGNQFTSSGPVAYTFLVVPEPGAWALMGLALSAAWLRTRRLRRSEPDRTLT